MKGGSSSSRSATTRTVTSLAMLLRSSALSSLAECWVFDMGFCPGSDSSFLDAISKCYFGARALLPDDGVLLRRGN